MSEYGVPESLDGALEWQWARDRLHTCRNFWIVTVSSAGRPHAMPVWGVWLDDPDQFWFSCANRARKAQNLAENPRVVVAGDDTVEVVSVEGVARPATVAESARAVEAYLAKYWDEPQQLPEMQEFLESNRMYFVDPERAFGIIEREEDFARCATRWVW
jgi:general stress protein 26